MGKRQLWQSLSTRKLQSQLGRGIKWASISNLVGKHKIDLLCLQETKRDSTDRAPFQALWGHSDFDWEWFPADNTAGGLLCVWNNNNFQVDIKIAERGFIMLEGVWLRVVVANIYASCELESKRQLWQRLYLMKNQSQVQCWCLVGDFNCIRHPAERVGSTLCNPDTNLIAEFNEWLAEMEGKPFTWVRPNGSCKSKLDRVLVSDDWVSKWPDSSQHNLERNYSDHCPIILNSKNIDWGPKPFRVFDAWLHNKDFNKYLGIPIGAKPSSCLVWEPLIKKFEAKLSKWNQEFLSMAGKVTLINSVLTALPIYLLSFFKIPQKVVQKVISLQRNFLWGGSQDLKKIAWVKWEGICLPKEVGGLGIKDITRFNVALLGRWLWALSSNQNQLWVRILTSKYGGWADLNNGRDRPWHSQWCWDLKWRGNLFDHEQGEVVDFMEVISNAQIQPQMQDTLRWTADPSGLYSTRLAYRLLITANTNLPQANIYKTIWRLNIPPRAAVFSWRLIKNRLPTRHNLLKRNVPIQEHTCPLCGSYQEEAGHLFFNCKLTSGLWWESMRWNRMVGPLAASPASHYAQFCDGFGAGKNQNRWHRWWIALKSSIWKHRNFLIFQGKRFEPPKVLEDALFLMWSWLKSKDKNFCTSFNYWSSNLVKTQLTQNLVESRNIENNHHLQGNNNNGILIVLDIPLREWVAITVIQTLRIMDWWLKDKGFQNLGLGWGGGGGGGLVLKQKIKFIKQKIRQWSISQGHISTRKVLNLKRELNALEDGLTNRILSQDEVKIKKSLQEQLWNRQKDRVRWLKEGDINSNYFHRLINHRRRQNAIQGLFINGVWVHDPSSVKNATLHYFKSRFAEENTSRPTLDGVQFPSLPQREKESLVARFSEVEIKSAKALSFEHPRLFQEQCRVFFDPQFQQQCRVFFDFSSIGGSVGSSERFPTVSTERFPTDFKWEEKEKRECSSVFERASCEISTSFNLLT
ncbi:putative ribonuclease H protein [Glycine soja]